MLLAISLFYYRNPFYNNRWLSTLFLVVQLASPKAQFKLLIVSFLFYANLKYSSTSSSLPVVPTRSTTSLIPGGLHFINNISFWVWGDHNGIDEYSVETVVFFFINSVFCRIVKMSYFTNHYLLMFGRNSTLSISKDLFLLFKNSTVSMINLLEILNIKIPRFCFHDDLSIAGNCRMCLVEVKSSLKPVISCATSAINGLLIHSNSNFVFRIRESILEFLLINHPLDCPICDEAGECDLQDQTYIFGSDQSRYKFDKRSVEDKSFHPLIKGIMTRCIHCTRCIRFTDEVLGISNLGMMGRGSNSEVSLFHNEESSVGIDSPFVGNLVDLCPVGALTSSPNAFSYRSWEFESFDSLDLLDSSAPSIRVDVRANTVMRILPRLNDISKEFISDNIRYLGNSLYKNRINNPFMRCSGSYVDVSWDFVFSSLTKSSLLQGDFSLEDNIYDHFFRSARMNMYIGDSVGLFTGFSYLMNSLKHKINIHTNYSTPKNTDFRSFFAMNNFFFKDEFMDNSLYYFNGINFLTESRYIGLRFFLNRENFSNQFNKPMYIGSNIKNYNSSYLHIGTSNNTSFSIMDGSSPFSFIHKVFSRSRFFGYKIELFSSKHFDSLYNMLYAGTTSVHPSLNYFLSNFSNNITQKIFFSSNDQSVSLNSNYYSSLYSSYSNNSIIQYFNINPSITYYSLGELGVQNNDFYYTSDSIVHYNYLNFYFNWSPINKPSYLSSISVFLGSYYDFTIPYSFILPIGMFFETTDLYVNNRNETLNSSKIIDTSDGMMSSFSFFYNLFLNFRKNIKNIVHYGHLSSLNDLSDFYLNSLISYYDYIETSSNNNFFYELEDTFCITNYRDGMKLTDRIINNVSNLELLDNSLSSCENNYPLFLRYYNINRDMPDYYSMNSDYFNQVSFKKMVSSRDYAFSLDKNMFSNMYMMN